MSTDRLTGARLSALLGLFAALLCLFALSTPAAAAPDPSPGQRIADALKESPVYVAPGLESAVTPADQRRLADRITESGIPIRVVLIPFAKGDAWGGDPDQLAQVLRDRLGGEAVLITTGDLGPGYLQGYEWPGDRYHASHAAVAVALGDEMDDAPLTDRLNRVVELIVSGEAEKAYEKASAELEKRHPVTADGDEGGDGGSLFVTVLLCVAGLAVLVTAVGYARLRRPRPAEPFASPRAVFAAARAADEQALRRRAQEEVLALGEDVADRDGATPAVGRALDAYTAATTVLDAADGTPDLAGVLALVAEGRDALRERPKGRRTQPRLPLCFFHPLHGRAVRRLGWRPLGRRNELEVAACEECAAAVRAHRAPEVLTDRVDGRETPYFEVPAERSLWAATGYGSFGDEPLAARVARGDFSRTRDRA